MANKKQEEKVDEAIVEESTEEIIEEVIEEATEEVVEEPVKSKKEIRGYRIINPKQPEGVYMQTLEMDGVKFFFYGNNKGEPVRGCLVSAKMKGVADKFKKEKGFKVEPFYGIQK